jgi:hypothetical protein
MHVLQQLVQFLEGRWTTKNLLGIDIASAIFFWDRRIPYIYSCDARSFYLWLTNPNLTDPEFVFWLLKYQ